ncbi:MAG: tetratricopeptide repeat protein [Bacteroidales bacterium]|nr:tetratricopeptide repeat protein [Bacteroidales bacterium]
MSAANDRQLIRQGNRYFEKERFIEAEATYRQVLETDPGNRAALYNLGNALYRQGRLEEAAEIYQGLTGMLPDEAKQAEAWHNLGNSLLKSGNIAESIEAYKQALRLAPMDDDTRYNLAYALQLLDELPPDDSPQNGEDGDDQDEQNDTDHEPAASPDDGQQEPQPGDSTPPRPDQLSPEDAERILEALRQQEQKIQEEINREEEEQPAVRPRRDW